MHFSPKRPTTFKSWEMIHFFIADKENVKKSEFDWLVAKLPLKEISIFEMFPVLSE